MSPSRKITTYPVDAASIATFLQADDEVFIQFNSPTYNHSVLKDLNELCASFDNRLAIRFYDHYSTPFDAQTLLSLPNIRHLHIDCNTKDNNIEPLATLQHLEKLSIDVYELADREILRYDNLKNLTHLEIGNTKVKGFNLDHLKNYHNLRSLIISEQTNNLAAVGALTKLQRLVLRSIKKVPLDFVNQLPHLKSLELYLGGREDLHDIGENNTIEKLVVGWVRGFSDLGNPRRFRQLKTLEIEDNALLTGIHFEEEMPHLEQISILNCKTFSTLTGLDKLPALRELRIYKTALDHNSLLQQALPASLTHLAFFTGKQQADQAIAITLQNKGFMTDFHAV